MTEEEKTNMEYRMSNVECRTSEKEPTVESVTEAVLFASDEPLSAERLADIVGTSVKQIRTYIKNLNDKYQANNNAFGIEQIASGYQMLTLSPYNHWLKKLRTNSRLSGPTSRPSGALRSAR
jgi:chromosome segregation and condensation protein ScpB